MSLRRQRSSRYRKQMTEEITNHGAEGAHANLEDLYELSPMQQGMLFHTLYAPRSAIYFEQSVFTIEGDFDRSVFQRAWQHVVTRHPMLRTAFVWEGLEKPLQIVYRNVNVDIEDHDWRQLEAERQQEMLEEFISDDQQRGFDLTRPPLLRLTLSHTADRAYKFVWSRHHLILDRWSRALVLRDFLTCYTAFSKGLEPKLEETRPYRDYIDWLLKQDKAKAESFWRGLLSGFESPTHFRVGSAPSVQRDIYDREGAQLSSEQTSSLRQFAREHKLTLNTLVQGAWSLLLSRYSGEREVLFGATVAGRPAELSGVDKMVGLFINTLPVRVRVEPQAPLLSWLRTLQENQAEQRQYEHSSLIDIQGWSEIPRGVPLFDSILVFENLPVESTFGQTESELVIRGDRSVGAKTNYPLTVMVNPGVELTIGAIYDSGHFYADSIRQLLNHFLVLLKQFITLPQLSVEEISLLEPAERNRLVHEWNQTQQEYEREACVHELIERQVAVHGQDVAVVFGEEQLSYAELNGRANRLAAYLRGRVAEESLVGIYLDRGLEMMIAVLAVWKAGAAYVPLAPEHPATRLEYMIADAGLGLIITQPHLRERLPGELNVPVVSLDDETEAIAAESTVNVQSKVSARSLAYVIYTSGSTGEPKAVEIPHTSVVNFLTSMQKRPGLGSADRLLAVTTLSFDIAALELYLPLVVGGSLELTSRTEAGDGQYLKAKLESGRITVMQATPATWRLLVEAGWEGKAKIKILCGGEALPRELANELLRRGQSVWNMYGPTETTIWSAVEELTESEGPVLLGEPIANTQLYVLDEAQQLVPIGVAGELYIGGAGLARGYHQRPGLTAERFVPDAYASERGARLYRTGDLVRRLTDGRLEFLGRLDHQVKIRGFRIETGEIESLLRQHPVIRNTVVVIREDSGDKRLVAYLVLQPEQTVVTDDLRAFVQQSLPDYMIPSAFVVLDELPLSASGKVDRRRLPQPSEERPELAESFIAPRTPIEQEVAKIWEHVLKVREVGVYDNFFALGGHSLLATQVVSRVKESLQIDMPLRVMFEQPTVAGFALAVTQHQAITVEAEAIQLLDQLAQLSDEEAQQLLDSEILSQTKQIAPVDVE